MSREAAVPRQEIAVSQPGPLPSGVGGSQSIYGRILKATALYSIATIAPLAVSMLALPLYTRFLTPADYGVLELLDATRIVFSMLIGARFTDALLYFYGRATTDESRRQSVQTVLYGSVLLAIFSAAAGWAVSPIISKTVFHGSVSVLDLRIVFASFGMGLPVEAVFARLKAVDDQTGYVRAALVRLALTATASIILVVGLRTGVTGVLVSALIANGLMFLSFLRSFPRVSIRGFQYRLLASQLRVGFLMTATGLAAFVINSGDRFFLARSVSLTDIGLYGIAYKCGMVVSVAQSAFGQYWGSQIYAIAGDTEGLARFRRIHTGIIVGLGYLAVAISGSANAIFHIAFPPAYLGAIRYIPWVALIYVIRADADYFRSALYVEGIPGHDTAISLIAGAVCLLSYALLIPRYGVWGAIGATALAFAVSASLARVAAVRKRPYGIEARRSGLAFALAIICCAAVGTISAKGLAEQCLALALAVCGYPAMLLLARCITFAQITALYGAAVRAIQPRSLKRASLAVS
jgi:O-antigen/teichoic acid export membrane protein